jgi:hypothetical protein
VHKTRKDGQIELEAQPTMSLSWSQNPIPVHANLDAQISSGLRFGSSIYVWKAEKTTFAMDLVPCQYFLRIDRNCQNMITSRVDLGAASPFFGPWAMYLV